MGKHACTTNTATAQPLAQHFGYHTGGGGSTVTPQHIEAQ